jgi:phospholipid-translocating ATPase
VADVISFIKNAGVKLWVLTGDKIETAINIGYSCDLLDNDMEIFVINESTTKKIYK